MVSTPSNCSSLQGEAVAGPLATAFFLLITKLYFEKASIGKAEDYPPDFGPDLLTVRITTTVHTYSDTE